MRPFVVVAIDEVIELGRLLQEVTPSLLCSLQLECQVYALMPAILLGMTLDPFYIDPQSEPSDGKPGQVEQSGLITGHHYRIVSG